MPKQPENKSLSKQNALKNAKAFGEGLGLCLRGGGVIRGEGVIL